MEIVKQKRLTSRCAKVGSTRLLRDSCLLLLAALWAQGFAAWGAGSVATSDYIVDTWQVEDGLPHNSVTAIKQARDGFLWIGTVAGLVRFDGVHFERFEREALSPLKSIRIQALHEDAGGTLWIGTDGAGVWRYSGGQCLPISNEERLARATVTCIAEDRDGRIWMGTSSGLNVWDRGRITVMTVRDGLPHDSVTGMHVARDGVVWIATRTGICQYRAGLLSPFGNLDADQDRNREFDGVYEDRNGDLWAFGDTFLLNLSQGKRFNYFKSSDPSSSRVWTLCEKSDGALWIGTGGQGLLQYRNGVFISVGASEGLFKNAVWAIAEDREGNLWAGANGGGLSRIKRRHGSLFRLGSPENPAPPVSLAELAPGLAWIGTEGGGMFHGMAGAFERMETNSLFQTHNHFGPVLAARDGTVWAGVWGAGLVAVRADRFSHYSLANGLSDNVILSLADDASGTLWAGSLEGQLNRFQNGHWTLFSIQKPATSKPVGALVCSRSGTLWIGTRGNGLLEYRDRLLKTWSQLDGLPSDEVISLLEDSKGRLWIGTSAGLTHFLADGRLAPIEGFSLPLAVTQLAEDGNGNIWAGCSRGLYLLRERIPTASTEAKSDPITPMEISRTEGMANLEFSGTVQPSCIKIRDGSLWFPTSRGILAIDPRQFFVNPAPPLTILERVSLDGETVSSGQPLEPPASGGGIRPEGRDRLVVPPGKQRLEFHYTAPSFTHPDKVRFKYQLLGFDEHWVDAGVGRIAGYNRIPAGNYTFRVVACNVEGIWNESGASISVEIRPPFWKTNWFTAIVACAGIAGVGGLARYATWKRLRLRLDRLKQQHLLEKERMRIAQDMHDDIGAKLTRISFLNELVKRELDSPAEVKRQLDNISIAVRGLIRSMDEIVWALNPRNDTLDNLATYLCRHASEFFQNTGVECQFDIPIQVPHHPLSTDARHNLLLAIKEALNNVLKHSGASQVVIRFRFVDNSCDIDIADNGQGFAFAQEAVMMGNDSDETNAVRRGNGIANMRRRLESFGGRMSIQCAPGAGATIGFHIELEDAS